MPILSLPLSSDFLHCAVFSLLMFATQYFDPFQFVIWWFFNLFLLYSYPWVDSSVHEATVAEVPFFVVGIFHPEEKTLQSWAKLIYLKSMHRKFLSSFRYPKSANFFEFTNPQSANPLISKKKCTTLSQSCPKIRLFKTNFFICTSLN